MLHSSSPLHSLCFFSHFLIFFILSPLNEILKKNLTDEKDAFFFFLFNNSILQYFNIILQFGTTSKPHSSSSTRIRSSFGHEHLCWRRKRWRESRGSDLWNYWVGFRKQRYTIRFKHVKHYAGKDLSLSLPIRVFGFLFKYNVVWCFGSCGGCFFHFAINCDTNFLLSVTIDKQYIYI